MRVSYIYWEPWFGGQPPHLDAQGGTEIIPGFAGIFAADVVVVHAPSILNSGQRKEIEKLRRNLKPEQVWIVESHESSVNYADQIDISFRSLFDAEMSHRQAADIWVPYFSSRHFQHYGETETGDRAELCCAFISSASNRSGREQYITELMKHVDIASYGRFRNNRRIGNDAGVSTKLGLMGRFTYALSFENSVEADYVTEKFFDPISVGTIPVYLGAPNIEEFSPGDDCFVDVRRFPEPRKLAHFLREQNPERFHAWRRKPLSLSLLAKLNRLSTPFQERFAALVAALVDCKRNTFTGRSP